MDVNVEEACNKLKCDLLMQRNRSHCWGLFKIWTSWHSKQSDIFIILFWVTSCSSMNEESWLQIRETSSMLLVDTLCSHFDCCMYVARFGFVCLFPKCWARTLTHTRGNSACKLETRYNLHCNSLLVTLYCHISDTGKFSIYIYTV
jgi:hypothetical protein